MKDHCDECGEHYGDDDMSLTREGNQTFRICHNCSEHIRSELKEEFGL